MWVNIGCSDAQIWNQSDLKLAIGNGLFACRKKTRLPVDDKAAKYYIIAGAAFAIRTRPMKQFSAQGLEKDEQIFIKIVKIRIPIESPTRQNCKMLPVKSQKSCEERFWYSHQPIVHVRMYYNKLNCSIYEY
jgi:hypothetical protein